MTHELAHLRALIRQDDGLTVFDAETQETSYGILTEDDLPFIFDTHRKDAAYVATVEALTEVVRPAGVTSREVARFGRAAERIGMMSIPYTACFFRGNLHVYSYKGPVRGMDLSVVGRAAPEAERRLRDRFKIAWTEMPEGIRRAQRSLLAGRRRVRYDADLRVLRTADRRGRTG